MTYILRTSKGIVSAPTGNEISSAWVPDAIARGDRNLGYAACLMLEKTYDCLEKGNENAREVIAELLEYLTWENNTTPNPAVTELKNTTISEVRDELAKRRFQVGDVVRLTGPSWDRQTDISQGSLVTISSTDRTTPRAGWVRVDSALGWFEINEDCYYIDAHEYTAEKVDRATIELQPGDTVRLTGRAWKEYPASGPGIGKEVEVIPTVKKAYFKADYWVNFSGRDSYLNDDDYAYEFVSRIVKGEQE